VKTALRLLGIDCGAARPPAAWPLNDNQTARIAEILKAAG
jgi:4-hydroxy-tetrahydrodipicolinate synthase